MSDEEYYSDTDDNISETNSEEVEPINKKPIITNVKYKDNFEPNVLDDQSSDEDDDEDVEEEFANENDDDEENTLVESDEEEDNDDEDEDDDEEVIITKKNISEKKSKKQKKLVIIDNDEDNDDEEYNDNYLEKFDSELVKNYIDEFHPECLNHNYDEISKLSIVVKNSDGIIIDQLHKTIPYLTKYEKTRILGQRSKQIETGSKPFINVPENIVDSYIIAELELKEKKIPFIIKRPIPNGGCEYWNLKDLEVISF